MVVEAWIFTRMRAKIGVFEDEESSQGSLESTKSETSKSVSVKSIPGVGAISEFSSKNIFDIEVRQCLKNIWAVLRSKITRTPLQFLSSIEEEIRGGVSRMKNFQQDFDLSHLEASINSLFTKAVAYDKARSASFEVGENSAQQIQKVKVCLRDARAREKEETFQVELIKNEIAELEKKKTELTMSLKRHHAKLQMTLNGIKGLKEEIEKSKDPPILDGEVLENLKNSECSLGAAQKSLEDQDPFA
ncbi:hypothetical protein OROGR_033060 [Orobanche gracilis]